MDSAAGEPMWLILDKDCRITSVSPGCYEGVRLALGKPIFAEWPDLEPHVAAMYERAWRDGHSCGVIEYPEGALSDVYVRRLDDEMLHVSWRVLTLPGLAETLRRISGEAARVAGGSRRARLRTDLRLVS